MKLEHKYIRLVKTEQEYQDLINNRQFEEAAVIAITNDRSSTPNEYQFSTRTTNEDNNVKGKYNAFDPIHTFGGLELIWGYFGWIWEDYNLPTGELDEEDNPITEPLKGGHFIILKDTTEYPKIYDGYRLQHINNLCSELKKNTNIGYFDNSEIVSAEKAFTNIVQSSGYTYYYSYGKLDEQDNRWPKLINVTDMFCSEDTFIRWSIPDTELYLPAVIDCNYLFNKYTLGKCPIVNFDKLEVITAFARSLYKFNSNDIFYFGDYYESIAKGLSKCYDYGVWNIYSQGSYKFKSAYIGDKTFILPRIEDKSGYVTNTAVECNIPWTIVGAIKGYGANTKIDLTNLDFSKVVVPEDKRLTLLQNVSVSQDNSNANYVPGLPNTVQKLWLMSSCPVKGNFVFDARNDNLDYDYFREFNGCTIPTSSDLLTINNLHLWSQIELNVSGNYRVDVENQTNATYRPYNINIQLCPKVGSNIQKVQFSYLKLPYMIHKDEDIELIGYDTIGYDTNNHITNECYFYGKYEDCTYHINIDKPVNFDFKLVDGVTPKIVSDIPICFVTNDFLGRNWGLDNAFTRKIYLGGLQLKDPTEIVEGMDTSKHLDYWYWYLPNAENLEYIELPIIDGMSYNFQKSTKLDSSCIVNHYKQLTGKGRTLTINRITWNNMSEEDRKLVESKAGKITIYENENN